MRATAKKRPIASQGATTAQPNTLARLGTATVRGSAWGLISAFVLSLVAALIAYLNADPNALLWPLALGCLVLSCVIAGFFSQRSYKAAPVVCGGVCGLALVIIFWLLSSLVPHDALGSLSSGVRWGLRGGAVGFCILGALMAANMPRGKRTKRRKRK